MGVKISNGGENDERKINPSRRVGGNTQVGSLLARI
jgi:hypothetical protein